MPNKSSSEISVKLVKYTEQKHGILNRDRLSSNEEVHKRQLLTTEP